MQIYSNGTDVEISTLYSFFVAVLTIHVTHNLVYSKRLFFSAYTMAKYGMSMCVLGMAEEFKSDGVAVNALWPKTGI